MLQEALVRRRKAGRILLTGILVTQAVLGFVLDWSDNHLLHPMWHPHARFHGALLLFLLAGVSGLGVWLLWRNSKEPEVAAAAAAVICIAFWSPFFYSSQLLPGSSLWAGDPAHIPHLMGRVFYPNVLTAGIFLVATFIGWRIEYTSLRHHNLPQ